MRGIELDIGAMPDPEEIVGDGDPTRAVRLTAHIVARVADMIPFTRKLSRHMEGTEKRAGIMSDVLALLAELARRNADTLEHAVETRVENLSTDVQRAKNAREAKAAAQAAAQNHSQESQRAPV